MAKKTVKNEKGITKVMRTKAAAPITATAIATAIVAIGVWAAETFAGVVLPAMVQGAFTGLFATYIWFKMPVEWETK
jgi:hypothetical protein